MIQGGGMTADMQQKSTRDTIPNEANNGLKNDKYTIAMARTSAPHSASAQFFINAADNDFLNFKSETPSGWGYAVFGKVVAGSEVVDAIEKVRTGRKGYHDDVPLEAITITKAVEITA
jgi:peptidyl-prolyl cis-trans isomerase B (cyclophilin B)